MKQFRKFINIIICTMVALFLTVTVVFHIPFVQNIVANEVASVLAKKLGTKIEIGRVDLGMLNRLVIDDVHIYDQKMEPMLLASRLSAKVDILPIFEGKISISSVQIFGLNSNLYKMPGQNANFQFVIDSLSSKNSQTHSPINLSINSLVIRNGKIKWNDYTKPKKEGFDVNHLSITNLSSHMLLNLLTNESIDLTVKRLSFKEASGLDLQKMSFRLKANDHKVTLSDFNMRMPHTQIDFPSVIATYKTGKQGLDSKTLNYKIHLNQSHITLADLAFIEPSLKGFENAINVQAKVEGSADNIEVKDVFVESDDQSIYIKGYGWLKNLNTAPQWQINALPLRTSAEGIKFLARNLRKRDIQMPEVIARLGNVYFKGIAVGHKQDIEVKGELRTDAGNAKLSVKKKQNNIDGHVKTEGINLRRILDNDDFGKVVADIGAKVYIPSPFKLDLLTVYAKGRVKEFGYKGYQYRNIFVDGSFRNVTFNGKASINDPNANVRVDGIIGRDRILATINAQNVNLHNLKLTDVLGRKTFAMHTKAKLTGADLDHLNGNVDISNFSAIDDGKGYKINHLNVVVRNNFRHRIADIDCDFAKAHISGIYDYQTLPNSMQNIIGHYLPSLFASKKQHSGNSFKIQANISNASILRELFSIPLNVKDKVNINGIVNDRGNQVDLQIKANNFIYDGNDLHDVKIGMTNIGESLLMQAQGKRISDNGAVLDVSANAIARADRVNLYGNWDLKSSTHNYGSVNANASIFRHGNEGLGVSIDFLPSMEVFDTIHVAIQPSHIIYKHNLLDIDNFRISNGNQRVIVNGQTTGSEKDSLLVDFENINLKYVLDLIGFDAVKFTGIVTGKGYIKSFFNNPTAYAAFDVNDFRFQGGEFGTLHATARYDNNNQRISVNSIADDGPDSYTDINGYVSIKDNYIDMPMKAHGTKMQFLEGFAGAVVENVKAKGDGWCRIFGDLSHVNLEGDMNCNGDIGIKQTKTVYTMHNSLIHMVPNEIEFATDTVYDKDGNLGIVTGAIHHKELHKMTFDIHVNANDMLVLNLPEYDDNTFKGVIYATGSCDVIDHGDGTFINANLTPDSKSYMEYNAGYSGGLDDNTFIHWKDVTPADSDSIGYRLIVNRPEAPVATDIPSDFTMNLLVNTTPDFTLRVLMDQSTGDYMDFHGNGIVRANYYNKGAFQMFGNYDVDYGNYTMTIQNLVKKVFTFQPGSTITFGGNPFDANLNLKAQYTVNGVSLSDLQMGRSFTSNTIRVNCLMNIGGTPLKPSVTFDLDLPSLSSDAREMVRSVINSEEDMNQQVLYLLAIGRFYNPGNNNAEIENNSTQSQTSLAMQSVLSGTLSQQINNVLSTVIHNANWNFGANISTGDEGWSDAEYEGLLSGRMLNNRLFFQGQFGYRDKVTTNNSSFIGDFDLRYLLTPNGNVAVRVYNQTNDRYFTRNSLTTQGIGFILKKDFNNWLDLFKRDKRQIRTKENLGKKKFRKKRGKSNDNQ